MFDVVALGELLIDFTPYGVSSSGMKLFEQNPGGAPANVLTALSKMGLRTGFIGKVGDDIHGLFLKNVLEEQGIDTSSLVLDKEVFTTLAFVELSSTGERNFSFARKPGADTCLTVEDVKEDYVSKARVFHFGSLSLTNEPSRSATIASLEYAKNAGVIISYDPNYRPLLWDSEQEAMDRMKSVLKYVDILKVSDEETKLLTGADDPVEASKILLDMGISIVAVTLGSEGAIVRTKEGMAQVPAFESKVVDTTGAGDSFWGGFLYMLIKSNKLPKDISIGEAKEFTLFANAVASLCVEKRGAIPAMPSLEEVEERLR